MLTDFYFNVIRNLIYEETGIVFDERKKYFVENRIKEHMDEIGINSFKEYLYRLKTDKSVMKELVSKVTVNETYFYREYYHLIALSRIVQTEFKTRKLRVLSIPCSSGEEPFTIAIVLAEVLGINSNFEVIGVDIDKNALKKANRAVYGRRSVSKLPGEYLQKYFDKTQEGWSVKPIIRKKVEFLEGNILDKFFLKRLGTFQIVFCKNLLIYFDENSRTKAINNLYDIIEDGGYLFLGHAESLSRTSSLFEPVKVEGSIVYRKPLEEEDEW